jgi:hypothetical protein
VGKLKCGADYACIIAKIRYIVPYLCG